MADIKTKPTKASVDGYIAAIANETRRDDCQALVKLMSKVTGEPPKMWGPSIVGFGTYHYKYDSGWEADMCIAGFSSRQGNLCVYLDMDSAQQKELLGKLGKHKTGKVCLYIRRLSDVDMKVLQQLVANSVADTRRRYG